MIIWFTGSSDSATLTETDRESLKLALDSGVNLFLNGTGIANDIGDTDFFGDYLHAAHRGEVYESFLDGIAGDPISDGMQVRITNEQRADIISPLRGSDSCFVFRNADQNGAVRYTGDYRLLYWGFGFEIIVEVNGSSRQDTVMNRIINWLGGIEEETLGPPQGGALVFSLGQNTPNPFSSQATINYELPKVGDASLKVYNILGQCVRVLAQGVHDRGRYTVAWDGNDLRGRPVASGVYFYHLEADAGSATRKMVLMK
jgi:hypothetical protein